MEVLRRLQENGLAVSLEKCIWKAQEVKFREYIIGIDGIKMSVTLGCPVNVGVTVISN